MGSTLSASSQPYGCRFAPPPDDSQPRTDLTGRRRAPAFGSFDGHLRHSEHGWVRDPMRAGPIGRQLAAVDVARRLESKESHGEANHRPTRGCTGCRGEPWHRGAHAIET